MEHKFCPETIFERDPIVSHFGKVNIRTGQFSPFEVSDLIERANALVLPSSVPEEIRKMFEVAKGIYIYGWCYYPLFTVAVEHCYKVVEAGVRHKYRELGGASNGKRLPAFRSQVEWLRKRGVVPDTDWIRWDATVELRNFASHPDGQTILMPSDALGTLYRTTVKLATLFPEQCPDGAQPNSQ